MGEQLKWIASRSLPSVVIVHKTSYNLSKTDRGFLFQPKRMRHETTKTHMICSIDFHQVVLFKCMDRTKIITTKTGSRIP